MMSPYPVEDSYLAFGVEYTPPESSSSSETEINSDYSKVISHRVSGSFHWSLKIIEISQGDKSFTPSTANVLTDTGTTMSYFPK